MVVPGSESLGGGSTGGTGGRPGSPHPPRSPPPPRRRSKSHHDVLAPLAEGHTAEQSLLRAIPASQAWGVAFDAILRDDALTLAAALDVLPTQGLRISVGAPLSREGPELSPRGGAGGAGDGGMVRRTRSAHGWSPGAAAGGDGGRRVKSQDLGRAVRSARHSEEEEEEEAEEEEEEAGAALEGGAATAGGGKARGAARRSDRQAALARVARGVAGPGMSTSSDDAGLRRRAESTSSSSSDGSSGSAGSGTGSEGGGEEGRADGGTGSGGDRAGDGPAAADEAPPDAGAPSPPDTTAAALSAALGAKADARLGVGLLLCCGAAGSAACARELLLRGASPDGAGEAAACFPLPLALAAGPRVAAQQAVGRGGTGAQVRQAHRRAASLRRVLAAAHTTPLGAAAAAGDDRIVSLLVEHGADPTATPRPCATGPAGPPRPGDAPALGPAAVRPYPWAARAGPDTATAAPAPVSAIHAAVAALCPPAVLRRLLEPLPFELVAASASRVSYAARPVLAASGILGLAVRSCAPAGVLVLPAEGGAAPARPPPRKRAGRRGRAPRAPPPRVVPCPVLRELSVVRCLLTQGAVPSLTASSGVLDACDIARGDVLSLLLAHPVWAPPPVPTARGLSASPTRPPRPSWPVQAPSPAPLLAPAPAPAGGLTQATKQPGSPDAADAAGGAAARSPDGSPSPAGPYGAMSGPGTGGTWAGAGAGIAARGARAAASPLSRSASGSALAATTSDPDAPWRPSTPGAERGPSQSGPGTGLPGADADEEVLRLEGAWRERKEVLGHLLVRAGRAAEARAALRAAGLSPSEADARTDAAAARSLEVLVAEAGADPHRAVRVHSHVTTGACRCGGGDGGESAGDPAADGGVPMPPAAVAEAERRHALVAVLSRLSETTAAGPRRRGGLGQLAVEEATRGTDGAAAAVSAEGDAAPAPPSRTTPPPPSPQPPSRPGGPRARQSVDAGARRPGATPQSCPHLPAPPGPRPVQPDRVAGWLLKRGQPNWLGLRRWRRRWFVLEGGTLRYYPCPEDAAARAPTRDVFIVLAAHELRRGAEPGSRQRAGAPGAGTRLTLLPAAAGLARVWELAGESTRVAESWVAALGDHGAWPAAA